MNELKEIMPYVALADNLEQSNQILAYYLRKYAIDKAYAIYQNLKAQNNPSAQEIQPYLDGMMKKTEQLSKSLGGQIELKSNITELLTYTEKIFLHSDDEYRAGRISPELTQSFQTAWRFYEIIGYFAKLSQDQNKRRLYAKAKAVEVHKMLKKSPDQAPYQPAYQTPPMGVKPMQSNVIAPGGQPTGGNRKKQIDPQRVQAQQSATIEVQNAISQLSFNRVNYARQNLKKALMILDRY